MSISMEVEYDKYLKLTSLNTSSPLIKTHIERDLKLLFSMFSHL